jgi:SAM-dependent methyltransferase
MKNRRIHWYERLFAAIGRKYLDKDYTGGTVQEVDFITGLIGDRSKKILDVGCGPGRHMLEFARRGYSVVGVDLSIPFLRLGKGRKNKSCDWICADARRMPFGPGFDWAICLCEGAFGILESDGENQKVLRAIAGSLKPGGYLLINVLNLSFACRYPECDERFDVKSCTGYWTETITADDGTGYTEKCANRYYSYPEMVLRLDKEGLEAVEVWGCQAGAFHKKALELDSFEILILARKIV